MVPSYYATQIVTTRKGPSLILSPHATLLDLKRYCGKVIFRKIIINMSSISLSQHTL
jgi:hypothetical protein